MADSPKPGAVRLGKPARVRSGRTHWTKIFLAELGATSNVSAAARKAGLSTTVVYETRRGNPAFARAWRVALCEGYDHLEMELLRRLRSGEVKPAPGTKRGARAFDNATALRLLAAHRETVAQERAVRDDADAEDILASINAKLERMRERSLAAKGRPEGAIADAGEPQDDS